MALKTHQSEMLTLASWMSGEFSNWEQAIENPPFFAHIRLRIRQFPQPLSDRGIWLYSEQAYDYAMHRPYRTAILHILPDGDDETDDPRLKIVTYKIKDEPKYYGASVNPERLTQLSLDDVVLLDGCNMLVQHTPENIFKVKVEPGKKCCVVRDGQETYLNSEFEISETRFISLERGYDPVTDERVWGSIAGPFEFEKKDSFAVEMVSNS
ncbi:chromophore lyase CpcT/CpeT [Pseudanabaena sp. PCC 6802]|uniref:chromophore lyase CpcT/CpeT n=1 Tax=Pseudanabaena sp. PCC 6802 TaxID=118173 RepID=UPI00034C385E|nr:chromophore lyase CpcT/CpeT [Pseudanabaena sp. PCC 6802]